MLVLDGIEAEANLRSGAGCRSLSMTLLNMNSSSTSGRQHCVANAGSVVVSLTDHKKKLSLPPHTHPHATVTIVLGGGYFETLRDFSGELPPLAAVVKPAETVHAN